MDLEEEGTVVEVTGGTALVRAAEKSQCSGCGAAGSCHAAAGGAGERIVEADNGPGAAPGDRVVIAVPPGSLLKASFQVYMVPVAGVLVGAALAQIAVQAAAGAEAAAAAAGLGGLAGAAAAVILMKALRRKGVGSLELRPRIVRSL